MNKFFSDIHWKAGLLACLFLLAIPSYSQEWRFSEQEKEAYNLTLNLKLSEARALLKNTSSPASQYIQSLTEVIELLVTEDGDKFSQYERRYEERIDKKLTSDPFQQFVRAEMLLQWAFVYLKFGHEFDAAMNIRSAYRLAEGCRKKNPRFILIRKTTGLLGVMIGSVPEKYNWVLGLLSIEGSVTRGLKDLEAVKTSDTPVAFETGILFSLIQGFILQKPDSGLAEIKKMLLSRPENRLLSFLGGSLAIKNAESERALSYLNTAVSQGESLPLWYGEYLKGEVYLHKGDYKNSIDSYRLFIDHYRGQNYIKDAWYKIGLCYWLDGKSEASDSMFTEARLKGKESTEADKYAARSLAERDLPNVKLSRVRFFTDGGYFSEADSGIKSITPADLPTVRDKVEYYYRKARLAHKQSIITAAKLFYSQTVQMAGNENWYFAPNACLQLGYIAMSENKTEDAKNFFKKALEYKKHEYKNSIDSKAKTALNQIKRR